jgi:hypothetical protein
MRFASKLAAAARGRAGRGWVLTLVALGLGVWGLARLAQPVRVTPAVDYYQFWSVALASRTDSGLDIYAPSAGAEIPRIVSGRGAASTARLWAEIYRARIDVYSSPFLYAVLGVASGDDYDRDRITFQVLSLAAFGAGVWLLTRALGYGRPAALAMLALCLAAHRGLFSDVHVGNVNRLEFAGLALAYGVLSASAVPGRALGTGNHCCSMPAARCC